MKDILERLRGYNPPDRTIDEQRQISQDIYEAATEIERLTKERDELKERLRGIEEASVRVVEWFDKGYLHHSIFCNYQSPEATFCNCGLATLRQAIKACEVKE